MFTCAPAVLNRIGGSDPLFANVVTLLNFQGSNGSTTITDNAPSPKVWTPSGNAQISNAIAGPFGVGETVLKLDGSGDWIDASGLPSLTAAEWTIEQWVWLASVSSTQFPLGASSQSYEVFNDPGGDVGIGGVTGFINSGAGGITAGAWHFLQTERNPVGNVCKFGVDGVWLATGTPTFGATTDLRIGARNTSGTKFEVNGYIGPTRITVGARRALAVPTALFPTS